MLFILSLFKQMILKEQSCVSGQRLNKNWKRDKALLDSAEYKLCTLIMFINIYSLKIKKCSRLCWIVFAVIVIRVDSPNVGQWAPWPSGVRLENITCVSHRPVHVGLVCNIHKFSSDLEHQSPADFRAVFKWLSSVPSLLHTNRKCPTLGQSKLFTLQLRVF